MSRTAIRQLDDDDDDDTDDDDWLLVILTITIQRGNCIIRLMSMRTVILKLARL